MRKRWLAPIGIAIAIPLAIMLCWAKADPPTSILAVQPADDSTAIIVSRSHDASPFRDWVSRVSSDGIPRWRVRLPGELSYGLVHSGVVIGDGVVGVRYLRDRGDRYQAAMVGLSFEDGRILWDQVLRATSEPGGATGPDLHAEGQFVVTLQWPTEIVALDRGSGSVMWRRTFDRLQSGAAAVIGEGILVEDRASGALSLDRRSGSPAYLPHRGRGCVIGDEYFILDRIGEASGLLAYRRGDPSTRRVVTMLERFDTPDTRLTMAACGTYKGNLVLWLVETKPSWKTTTTLVVLDEKLRFARTFALGPSLDLWTGSQALAGDTVTRFMPHVRRGDDDSATFTLIDLEYGFTDIEFPLAATAQITRAGSRWLVSDGSTLRSVDGNAGAILARIRGAAPWRALHVSERRIWIHEERTTKAEEPAILVLDAATLLPIHDVGQDLEPLPPTTREP